MNRLEDKIIPGLCSITFRKLTPERVAALVASCGLRAVEWGGDVHAPHGDVRRAEEVRRITEDAGLSVSSYGSYFKFDPSSPLSFDAVLDSACALGAPAIRVWAGVEGSAAARKGRMEEVARDARIAAESAAARGVKIFFEWHGGTLTDCRAPALSLIKAIGHPACGLYWQPVSSLGHEENLADLEVLSPYLGNLHVFHWTLEAAGLVRHSLQDGAAPWSAYFHAAARLPTPRHALFEFVEDDSEENFKRDAATLLNLLKEVC